jgi:hypothetical protein
VSSAGAQGSHREIASRTSSALIDAGMHGRRRAKLGPVSLRHATCWSGQRGRDCQDSGCSWVSRAGAAGNRPHRVDQEEPCHVALHRMLFGSKDAAWARAGVHQRRPLHDFGQACGLYGRREQAAHDAVMA